MSRGKKDHPPKKKHQNKPRPAPIVPLSNIERESKAQSEFEKSMIFLIEAERLADWGKAPNACAHAAYYAMYHCAAAAILASGGVGKRGDVPQSHEHVLQHYGKLVQDKDGDLGESGRMLGRARTDRMVADYDLVRGATNNEATLTTQDARRFITANMTRWKFYDNVTDDLQC